jgi:MFS family permease
VWCGGFVTMMSAGYLTVRFGALRISQMCLVFCALGLLCSVQGSIAFFIAAALFIGLGHGAETPSSSHLLARITPVAQQPFIFSLKQTGVQIGGVLAGFVYPALLAGVDWRSALLLAVAMLGCGIVLLELPRKQFEADYHTSGAKKSGLGFVDSFRVMLADWRILSLSIMSLSYVGMQITLSTFLVSYLVAERGSELTVAGIMLALAQAGGMCGRLLWGGLSGRVISARALLAGLGFAMAVCTLLLGAWGTTMPYELLGALCFAFGLTASGWNGVQIAELASLVAPEHVSQVTGAAFFLGMLGLIGAPLLFSTLASATSFGTAYLIMAAWAALGIITMLITPRTHRKHSMQTNS